MREIKETEPELTDVEGGNNTFACGFATGLGLWVSALSSQWLELNTSSVCS